MARLGTCGSLCAVGCTTALAACGASSTARGGSSTARGGRVDPALKLARCMRAHGVPNFPDPPAGGPPVIPNSINTNAPAFHAAQRACNGLLPAGGSGARQSSSERLAMVAIARCLRAHGLPSFPDPTATPPSVGARCAMQALGRDGLFLVISDRDAPAFKHAAAACHFQLPRPRSG